MCLQNEQNYLNYIQYTPIFFACDFIIILPKTRTNKQWTHYSVLENNLTTMSSKYLQPPPPRGDKNKTKKKYLLQ